MTVYYLLLTGYCLRLTTYYLLLTTCHILLTTYYLLLPGLPVSSELSCQHTTPLDQCGFAARILPAAAMMSLDDSNAEGERGQVSDLGIDYIGEGQYVVRVVSQHVGIHGVLLALGSTETGGFRMRVLVKCNPGELVRSAECGVRREE